MANSNTDVFAIKTVQSLLREVKLYGGRIDGLFGKNCRDAFVTLLKSYQPTFSTPLYQGSYDASQVFNLLQTGLAAVGLYTDTVDGKWGNNTSGGMEKLVQAYRTKNNIPELWYAWSGNPNVPAEGIRKYEA